MARLCERPGCSAPAACGYSIDTKRLRVRIESLTGDDTDRAGLGHRAGVLCRRHADSMVVPLGWTLDDRRPTDRRAAPAIATQPPPSAPRRAVRRRERHDSVPDGVEQLALLSIPEDPPDVRPAAAPPDARRDEAPAQPAASGANDTAITDDGAAPGIAVAPTAAEVPEPAADDDRAPADAAAAGDDAPADPWRPVFDQTDDLGGLLTARSPLLSRAFGRRERGTGTDSNA